MRNSCKKYPALHDLEIAEEVACVHYDVDEIDQETSAPEDGALFQGFFGRFKKVSQNAHRKNDEIDQVHYPDYPNQTLVFVELAQGVVESRKEHSFIELLLEPRK